MARKMYARVATHFIVDRNSVKISKEVIGKGSSSKVFQATLKRSDGSKEFEEIAAKKVSRHVENEVKVLKRLYHKNIITFYGAVPDLEGLDTFILMEIAQKGDLFNYLRKHSGPVNPSKLRWKWVFQAASAVQYLHNEDLVHKDIKSPNFLIMADNTLKLGDFGLAKEMLASQHTNGTGTDRWMAPEVLIKNKRSKKSDVYSFGVVAFEMETGEIPFHDKEGREVSIAVYEGERLSIPNDCHPMMKHILESCLESDYKKRTTIDGVFHIINNFDPEKYQSRATSCDTEQPRIDAVPTESQQMMDFEEQSSDDTLTSDTLHNPHFGNTREPFKDTQLNQKEKTSQHVEHTQPWCKCGMCRCMPTEIEKKCCNGVKECLSFNPKIQEFLEESYFCTSFKPSCSTNEYFSHLRRKTYRKFVTWQHHGKSLGRGNRVVIPSCCVWKIRDYYPDSENYYIGYAPSSQQQ